jgi:hypothetical protein
LPLPGGQVTVIVTGTMTVTSNAGPPSAVPVDERVTLRRITRRRITLGRNVTGRVAAGGAGGDPATTTWEVTGVDAGVEAGR